MLAYLNAWCARLVSNEVPATQERRRRAIASEIGHRSSDRKLESDGDLQGERSSMNESSLRLEDLPVEILELILIWLPNSSLAAVRLTCSRLKAVATPLIHQPLTVRGEVLSIGQQIPDGPVEPDVHTKTVRGGLRQIEASQIGGFILESLSEVRFEVLNQHHNIRRLVEYLAKNYRKKLETVILIGLNFADKDDILLAEYVAALLPCVHIDLVFMKFGYRSHQIQDALKKKTKWLRLPNNCRNLYILHRNNTDFQMFELIEMDPAKTQLNKFVIRNINQEVHPCNIEPLLPILQCCQRLKVLDFSPILFTDMSTMEWLPQSVEHLKIFSIPVVQKPESLSLKRLEINANARFIEHTKLPELESVKFTTVEFERPHLPSMAFLFQNSPKLRSFSACYDQESDLIRMLSSVPQNSRITTVHLSLWPDYCMGREWPNSITIFKRMKELMIRPSEFTTYFYSRAELTSLLTRLLTSLIQANILSRRQFDSFKLYIGIRVGSYETEETDELMRMMPIVGVKSEPSIPSFQTHRPAPLATIVRRLDTAKYYDKYMLNSDITA